MVKINNKPKRRCQRQKHFRLGVIWEEQERREIISGFRREREIREESCDCKLKITVAVAESLVHVIKQWDRKILERLKPHNLAKSLGKRTSCLYLCWRSGTQR